MLSKKLSDAFNNAIPGHNLNLNKNSTFKDVRNAFSDWERDGQPIPPNFRSVGGDATKRDRIKAAFTKLILSKREQFTASRFLTFSDGLNNRITNSGR